ncbi:hypothetical protein ACFFWC_26240 [Plantactinospora siamensis]|uniref:Uncharacterized protein n=1 Tax=Plantactinospora siamensis TaxID=555372 RepID=A0ABV6P842_9ACTN
MAASEETGGEPGVPEPTGPPAEADRIDFGDLAQRAELDGPDLDPPVEPVELVDAPVPAADPPSRGGRHRGSGRSAR